MMKNLQSLVQQAVQRVRGERKPPAPKPPKVALPKIVRHMIRTQLKWSLQTVNRLLAERLLKQKVTTDMYNSLYVAHIGAGTNDLRVEMHGWYEVTEPHKTLTLREDTTALWIELSIYIHGAKEWPRVEVTTKIIEK